MAAVLLDGAHNGVTREKANQYQIFSPRIKRFLVRTVKQRPMENSQFLGISKGAIFVQFEPAS